MELKNSKHYDDETLKRWIEDESLTDELNK